MGQIEVEGMMKNLLGRKQVLKSLIKRPGAAGLAKLLAELDSVEQEIRNVCEINRLTYSIDLDQTEFLRIRQEALLQLNTVKNSEAFQVRRTFPTVPVIEAPSPEKKKPGRPKKTVQTPDFEDTTPPPLKVVQTEPELRPGEMPDIQRMRGDFKHFCRHALKIAYRSGMTPVAGKASAGPFIFNSAQDQLWSVIGTLLLTRKIPVRIKLLKARQLGCTTWLLAFWVWMCLTRPNYNVMFIIDKDEHNVTKREMVLGWLKSIKENFGGSFAYLEKKESGVLFLSNKSKIFFESAQSSNPGTSETIMGLHESEKPKWPNNRAKQVQESVTPGLPFQPYTMHVDESTAVGMDEFYEGYRRAKEQKEGEDDYVLPIFLPWYLSPEYSLPETAGFSFQNDDEELKDVLVDDETGEEKLLTEGEYAKKYKLTKGQILWRRRQIKKTFEGVRDSFDQEYPTTDTHAWRNTNTNFFTKSALQQMGKNVSPPIFRGRCVDKNGYSNIHHPCFWSELVPDLQLDKWGELCLWEYPIVGMTYVLGADFCEGKTITTQGEQESDETVFSVKDRYGRTVALYTSRCKPEEAWLPMLLLALLYNKATVNGERNSIGNTVLSYFITTGYPNNLVNQYPESRPAVERMWTTVNANRIEILNKLRSSYSIDPKRVFSHQIHSQVEHFINKMIGSKVKPQAANGRHDDCVMAEAHANWCLLWVNGGKDTKMIEVAYIPPVIVPVQTGWTLKDTDLYDD